MNTITAIIRAEIKMPNPIPALNIPAMASQELSILADSNKKNV